MRAALVCIPLLALAACNSIPKMAGGAGKDSVSTLIREYQDQANAAKQASTAKDSVISELATATKLMDELGTLEKDIGIKSKAQKGEAVEKWDTRAQRRLEEIRAHFKSVNARLAKLSKVEPENAALQEQIKSLTALVDQKQQRISELEGQLASAQQQNTQLTAFVAARGDTIKGLVDESNKVYYIAGLKDELIKEGVVREVGGTRALLVARLGKSLAPAPTLKPSQFKVADMRTLKEIPLDGRYQVVTPQDVKYATGLDEKGKYVTGNLGITDPQFWGPSRFLILVKK